MSRTSEPAAVRLRSRSQAKLTNHFTTLKHSSSNGSVNIMNTPEVISTPSQNGISHLRQRLEDRLEGRGSVEAEDNTSPGLARLRMTPGRILRNKQEVLIKKHEEVRQRADKLSVGGGVSLWPQMERMKLNSGETIQLILTSLGLMFTVVFTFYKFHGCSLADLQAYTDKLNTFSRHHVIGINEGQERFKSSLISWHTKYKTLLSLIHKRFDINSSSGVDIVFLCGYLMGLAVLMYYLVDNMFAKSRLSPRRIKNWVTLLTVIGTWTVLLLYWLVLAHQLEYAVETNVHRLSETLGDLVDTDLDLQIFHTVLSYWRTRCLPPTTHGTLSILSVLPVRDVMYYLQYYSLPIITVLLTPVLSLMVALCQVYRLEAV
ncbi:uncharacterized protein LOC124135745 [Haliotis rufescens]|uniref:uncharacterized protein LOC124135745 n=1 Tax=Haliotis rufescens TaxID=6454 RepID=UPI00201EB147|nr:uncharacterized protein LOC124135745 [Haliotis rufescens]XP_046357224.2 uncharacterized protein LOC124135745 [Haliotis rufescens]